MDLLKSLTVQQIEQVRKDFILKSEGYTPIYVLDTHDIIDYAFPYGFQKIKNENLEEIGDQQLAYFYIIDNSISVLSDQYFSELNSIRTRINRNYKHLDNLNDLKKQIENETFTKNTYDEKYISFIIAAALGTKKRSVEKFHDIINKLNVDSFKISSSDKERLTEIFQEVEKSENVQKIFDEFYDDKKLELLSLDSVEAFEYIEKSYRDIIVIDRILEINKFMTDENTLSNKYIVYYHSSTKKKSKELFNFKNIKTNLPKIGKFKNFPLLRNSAQSYLTFLLNNTKEYSYSISVLDDIISEVKFKEESQKSLKPDLLFEKLATIEKEARDSFEYTRLLNRVNEIHELKQSLIEFKNSLSAAKNPKELTRIIQNILEQTRDNSRSYLREIDNLSLFKIKMNYHLSKNYYDFLKSFESGKLNIIVGNDNIRGTYHHLPILIFFNSKLKPTLKDWLNKLIKYCSKQLEQDKYVVDFFKTEILDTHSGHLSDFKLGSFDRALLNLFLFQVSPKSGNEENENIVRNEQVAEYSFTLKDFYEKLNYETIIDNHKINLVFSERKAINSDYSDILYFTGWSARRSKDYIKSIEILDQGVKLFPTDPRFYHGLAITYYSKHFKYDEDQFDSLSILINCESYALKALDFYEDHRQKAFVLESICSLRNLIINIYNYQYSLSLQDNLLIRARLQLKKLKVEESYTSRKYESYAEYLHTESSLEYFEAFNLMSKSDFINADYKLFEAELALQKALKFETKNALYLKLQSKILLLKDELEKAANNR